MQLFILPISLAATTVQAAALLHQRTITNVAQVRLYSSAACAQIGNQGEWTVRNATGDLGACNALTATAAGPYLSIVEQYANPDPLWASCATTVYSDAACSLDATKLSLDVCVDAPAVWGSFDVVC